ncbi:cysteine-rich CWC family protein [Lysinibacillus fusiformis]|uniref:cysteine-rich CWC family protein n=2 Tax=Lysinibacillus fusiformis TaxID=28031 RepID=UPI00364A2DA2
MMRKEREVQTMSEKRCPRCGKENHCGVVKGEKECWCMTQNFPEKLLNMTMTNTCICQACLDTYKEESV